MTGTATTISSSSSAKGRMIEGKYSEAHLCKTAQDVVNKKTADSKILDRKAEGYVPKFDRKEVSLGRVLGRGGFGVVSEINKIQLLDEPSTSKGGDTTGYDDEDDDDDDLMMTTDFVQNRTFMGSHYLRGKKKDSRYAIKLMQESCYNDASTFINAVVDLAMEARFLTVVRHSNIIKMRAMSVGSPYDAKFFVIMDRLYDTLFVRLKKWKKQEPKGIGKLLDRKGKKKTAFWVERVTVAYDLTCALKYLHDNHIMYRDLKPDNIGFDVRGDVKIFDFGLAKEFDPVMRDPNGFYKFTGDTGSPRYMDPTVALEQPYDERCDVYSFCILLWEMLELSVPFQGYTVSMFNKKVVKEGARPMINPKWPAEISKIMKEGWGDISNRPSMAEVSNVLREELNEYSEEDDFDETIDISRKSEISLRNMNRSKSIMSMRALKFVH